MKKGVIVVLAGSDGAGKSTQYPLLVQRAQQEGFSTQYMKYPDESNPLGKLIRDHYLGGTFGKLEDLNPYAMGMLFGVDRYLTAKRLKDWKNQGQNVILDRYFESNLAYQGGRGRTQKEREHIIQTIWDMEINKFGVPEPNLTVYLDLPSKESVESSKDRDSDPDDIFDNNPQAQEDTRFVYEWLLEKYENHSTTPWARVNCLDDQGDRIKVADLHEIIWSTVVPTLVK